MRTVPRRLRPSRILVPSPTTTITILSVVRKRLSAAASWRARHRGEPVAEARHVVIGQAEQPGRRDRVGDLLRRLDGQREVADEVVLRRGDLAVGGHLVPHAIQLVQHLREGAVRDGRAHLGVGHEHPQPHGAREPRVRAVGPALLLAQDQEEPGVGPAAQDLVHDGERIHRRIARGDHREPGQDVGLHRARLVDQDDLGRGTRRNRRERGGRRGRAAPTRRTPSRPGVAPPPHARRRRRPAAHPAASRACCRTTPRRRA